MKDSLKVETITWVPGEQTPDADNLVTLCTEEDGVLSGYWDDEAGSWIDSTGVRLAGVRYWAEIQGPALCS